MAAGRSPGGRPRVGAAINKELLPVLRSEGFTVEDVPGVELTRWRPGARFVHRAGDREAFILTGSAKFGHQLALIIGRSGDGRTFEGLRWDQAGLDPSRLHYTSQAELVASLLDVVGFLRTTGFRWLKFE